jgi:enamine deaminase RidA (YjgF/YER057c/UK114 family)
MMDCWVLAGSGEYMRRQGMEQHHNQTTTVHFTSPYAQAAFVDTSIPYRKVLHVQSLSHWAPVCVGPYSQANTLLGALHFLAGSIGLQPASMKLQNTWTLQLEQSWKNLANILDALDQSSLTQYMLSGMVYVSDGLLLGDGTTNNNNIREETIHSIVEISRRQILSNAGVVPGLIDDIVTGNKIDHNGYEDEETRIELDGDDRDPVIDDPSQLCPLLVVGIPAMPVNAQIEVEIVTATSAAVKCMPISTYRGIVQQSFEEARFTEKKPSWDAGYDFNGWTNSTVEVAPKVFWSLRCLGFPGAAFATVAVESGDHEQELEVTLARMIKALTVACSGTSSTVSMHSLVSIRLYYDTVCKVDSDIVFVDMASRMEVTLVSALPKEIKPAVTVVPVHDMHYIDLACTESTIRSGIALQAFFLDVPSLRTELWIRQGRPNDI